MISRIFVISAVSAILASGHTAAGSPPPTRDVNYGKAFGWMSATDGPGVPEGQSESGYLLGRDTSIAHSGRGSGVISAVKTDDKSWRSLIQTIRADAFRGKRIRFTGYLKTKNVGGAGLWMRVDGIDHMAAFDNMGNRLVKGTTNWKAYTIVVDVPQYAVAIAYGSLILGAGQCWIDDLSITPISPSASQTTGIGWLGPDYSHDPVKPQNMDFSAPPKSNKLSVPGWTTPSRAWNEFAHRDTAVTRNGSPTVQIYKTGTGEPESSIYQEIKAAPYRGKRIQFQAYVKGAEKADGGSSVAIPGGGQWAVTNFPHLTESGSKWVADKREWKPVSTVLEVPEWANCIQIAVQLNGPGKLWVSDTSFKVVSRNTPLTYCPPLQKNYSQDELRHLPASPVNLNFER